MLIAVRGIGRPLQLIASRREERRGRVLTIKIILLPLWRVSHTPTVIALDLPRCRHFP